MVKRRSKIILGILTSLGGLLFSIYFPPTRLIIGKAANESALDPIRVWGLSVLSEHPDPENLTQLQDALFDESSEVRLAAVKALGQLGAPAAKATADLVKASRDENNDVSKAAAEALKNIGAAGIDGLIEQLASPEIRYRQAAATALLNLKEEAEPARLALLTAIFDENVGVQILSIECLRFLPKPELSIPSLLKVLDLPDESVRTSATKVTRQLILTPGYLESRGKKEPNKAAEKPLSTKEAELILGELMKALINDDPDRRIWAAHMLGKCGLTAQEAIPELLNNCASKNDSVRVSALICVVEICRPIRGGIEKNLLKLFINSTKEKQPEARKAALKGLSIKELDPAGTQRYPAIVTCFSDKNEEVAAAAALALVLEGSRAVPTLIRLLSSKNEDTSNRASGALAFIGKPAIRSLRLALKHKTLKVRKGSAEALAHMGDLGIPVLIAAVKGESTDAQSAAIYGLSLKSGAVLNRELVKLVDEGNTLVFIILRNMGERANALIPRLIQVLKNSASPMHSESLKTLSKIGLPAKDAIPAVLPFLQHSDSLLRRNGIDALGAISPFNKKVINALEYKRGDKVPFVREAADDALAAIRERAKKPS